MTSGTGMGLAQLASLDSSSDGGSASQALSMLWEEVTSAAGAGLAVPTSLGWELASPAVVAWWERGLLQPVQAVGWKQTEKCWLGNYLLCV